MKKIVFVNPPNGDKKINNFTCGLFSLGSILLEKGYDVRIIDVDYLVSSGEISNSLTFSENVENICEYITRDNPDVVSFYTMSNNYYLTIYISKYLKEKNREIKIVFGGPQATLSARETIKLCSWIECIGVGEGEKSIENIIYNLVNDIKFTNEKGVAYLKNGQVVENDIDLIENLDDTVKYNFSLLEGKMDEQISIDVGRGCPFECKYCSTKTFWKRNYRLKSSKRIVEEIEELQEKFGTNKFAFEHDLFTVDKNKIMNFCNMLIEKNIDISWGCSSRIDTLDEELVKKMVDAGCRHMYLGIESGSQRIQNIIKKRFRVDEILDKVILLRKYNIQIIASFIYGFPEEIEDDVNSTMELIRKLVLNGVNSIQTHMLSIFPGTEYLKEIREDLYLTNKFSNMSSSKYIDKNDMRIVENNIEMFSQYLDFDLGIRQEISYLGPYITLYFRILVKIYKKTYEYLLDILGSHLNVFKEFMKLEESAFMENTKQTNAIQFWVKNISNNLYIIIENLQSENNGIILEVFKFEKDIADFIYHSTEIKDIREYNLDVYKIRSSEYIYYNEEKANTKIQFMRLNKKYDINIKKVI